VAQAPAADAFGEDDERGLSEGRAFGTDVVAEVVPREHEMTAGEGNGRGDVPVGEAEQLEQCPAVPSWFPKMMRCSFQRGRSL
jgi:hypothetical protein